MIKEIELIKKIKLIIENVLQKIAMKNNDNNTVKTRV